MVQVIANIINITVAIAAVYGAVMSTVNQLQIRRQTRRILLVSVMQDVMQLPRIPDDQGGSRRTSTHVFIIRVVNPGLIQITLKDTGMILTDGKLLTQGFEPKQGRKLLPFDLAPGADYEVRVDAYEVHKAMKGNGNSGKEIIRGYFTTPLKQFKSKKVRLNMEQLANDIEHTEGTWRK